MTNELALHMLITVPFAAGVAALVMGRWAGGFVKLLALAAAGGAFWAATGKMGAAAGGTFTLLVGPEWAGSAWAGRAVLALDGLNSLILLGAGFFAVLMALYSIGFLKDDAVPPGPYYASFLWVVGSVSATILASDLVVLTFFWALMGIPFFLLINMGREKADYAAKKTLIVLGGSDGLLILGVAIIYKITGSTALFGPAIDLGKTGTVACLCLAAAAFAKAGAMPLHSWVPDAAETAPVPAVALLPASLDKLLGIYLFARISLSMFAITAGMRAFFIIIGAVTVMAAVMAALVQHNLRRLLGFHAVSQVGYMVLGITTGTPVGVLGGLFHMVNHAIYKSCLFLTAGAVERRTNAWDLDKMGGLARAMPGTFVAALIAAMAISGVPPLNGFVSKWMVYQGIIEMGPKAGLWVVALVAAMFGSALTLASFVKVLHSVFLGQSDTERRNEGPTPNAFMGIPMAVLAGACLAFGIFAYSLPVKYLLLPALPQLRQVLEAEVLANPAWKPGLATLLLCSALAVGAILYALTRVKVREDAAYIGGEIGARGEQFRFSGVEFYRTVAELPVLRRMYKHSEEGWYDIYHLGRRLVFYVAGILQEFHSGLLLTYVAWCIGGLVILLWFLLGAR